MGKLPFWTLRIVKNSPYLMLYIMKGNSDLRNFHKREKRSCPLAKKYQALLVYHTN